MRKSISSNNQNFKVVYNEICTLINNGIKVDELQEQLEKSYLPNEVKTLLNTLGSVKKFTKVDKIQIIYRIIAFIVLLQFVINLLFLAFLYSAPNIAHANVNNTFLSFPILLSLIGIIISILLVINSVWENSIYAVIVILSFLFYSQVYNDTFIIFKTTSVYYWIPLLFFVLAFLMTLRTMLPQREKILKLLKNLRQNHIEITSIPDELSNEEKGYTWKGIIDSLAKTPNSKNFFANIPYQVKKNPTESDLGKWINKKRRNNKILILIVGITIFVYLSISVFLGIQGFDIYEFLEFLLLIGFLGFLLIKKKSLDKIDNEYVSEYLKDIQNIIKSE
jgi:hypothetical protein